MLKYVNTGVVFQEIPDEVTLAVNISNCPCHCPGCHSRFLWEDIGNLLTTQVLDNFVQEFGANITCICFMGGDAEPLYVNTLARYLHTAHPKFKVGWYSGRLRIPSGVQKADFDYIKIGPYIAHLGPLNRKTTNQRLYKRLEDNKFMDITARFWKK
jgi:anaerobic ribonucleoside-triphosphate reductase activating protein